MTGGLAEAGFLARRLFERLAAETADAPGVTRIAYGEGERAAFRIVADAARAWDAEVAHDAAGNQFVTLPGRDRSRSILIGSHLDSVPHGGNFDGAAGVLLGIALQAALSRDGSPPFDLTVLCLRAEESCWFPHSYIGSKSALGILDPEVLDGVARRDSGMSLAEHMRREGFDPEGVRRGDSRIDCSRVLAYIEPHIEQAPLLLRRRVPLGIVTGIRGSFRCRDIEVIGEYAHSGAMPRALRKDAVLTASRFVSALHEMWLRREAGGEDLTVTVGEFETDRDSHSFSKVAGRVHVCLDIRSQSEATLASVHNEVAAISGGIAQESGVQINLGLLTSSRPAMMSEKLNSMMRAAFEMSGIPVVAMASGAGHDAATFSQAGIPSAMLFIRNENGSHNPDEAMDMADFDSALAVLHALIVMPASAWSALRAAA